MLTLHAMYNVIKNHVTSFYQELFSSTSSTTPYLVIVEQLIPSLVTNEENILLTKLSSAEEIKSATFSLDASSAPRLDGFKSVFYQHCWDIIGLDFVTMVQDFFFPWVSSYLI